MNENNIQKDDNKDLNSSNTEVQKAEETDAFYEAVGKIAGLHDMSSAAEDEHTEEEKESPKTQKKNSL